MAVSTCFGSTLTLLEDGSVCVFGSNECGQLGTGTTIEQHNPIVLSTALVFAGEKMVMVATGVLHSACVSEVGAVWTWGNNSNGQLGRGPAGHSDWNYTPGRIGPSSFGHSPAMMVVCGSFFTIILTDAGHVWTFGCNHFGTLGLGQMDKTHIPTQIDPVHFAGIPIGMIAQGGFKAMAIDREGRALWAWGYNCGGMLGLGVAGAEAAALYCKPNSIFQEHYKLPMGIPAGAFDGVQIAFIGTGHNASMVVTVDGTLWACGLVPYVDFLDGDKVYTDEYMRVGGAEVFGEGGVRMVGGDSSHSFIVGKNGSVWCSASTHSQQLRRIDMSSFRNPRIVFGVCGWGKAIAVSANGRVFTWGRGDGIALVSDNVHGDVLHTPQRLPLALFNGQRVGRWYGMPLDIIVAFAMGRHANFAAVGGRTAYSGDNFPEELLFALFEGMRFRPRADASSTVNLLLGMDLE